MKSIIRLGKWTIGFVLLILIVALLNCRFF